MFDTHKAAEFFVVGWCKDWTLGQYLRFIEAINGDEVDWDTLVPQITAQYPWLPTLGKQYANSVRSFVGSAYPKLSSWMLSRISDVERLKCAAQVERLRPPCRLSKVSDSDRVEMKSACRDERQASASYKLSRDSFKTHQRSAWNVCK